MSNETNSIIVERAYALAEDLTSTTSGRIISASIERYEDTGDLDRLLETVQFFESKLAAEHFYDNDILGGENDAY